MQQMPKHFQTSALNVAYDKTAETNRNNDKNCTYLGKFSCGNECGFFCVFRCDNLIQSFWNKNGNGSFAAIAISPSQKKRRILLHSNLKIAHKNWIFFSTILCKFGTYISFFSKQNTKMDCVSSFRASFSGQVNICYHLPNG